MNTQADIARARQNFDSGSYSRAKRICERVLAGDATNSDAYDILGCIELQRGRHALAIPLLEKACAFDRTNADKWSCLGFCHQAIRQLDQALEAYAKALNLNPKNYIALFGTGASLAIKGDMKKGEKYLVKAIGISNQFLEPYRLLATMTERGKQVSFLNTMLRVEKQVAGAPPAEQAQLQYAIAAAYEKQGNKAKFVEHTEKANALMYSLAPDWYTANKMLLDFSRTVFTKDLFKGENPASAKKVTPIFIVGLPRSGSTLVEQILSSHPEVHGSDELPYIRRFYIEDMGRNTGKVYPTFVPALTAEEKRGMADLYQDKVMSLAPGSAFMTDKMVGNSFFVGIIRLIMPWAKVIHVKRHPCDTALSMYSRFFDTAVPYANNLVELSKYLKLNAAFMDLWNEVCPDFVHEVRYEDIVADLEGESKKMVKFCGLKWDPACLDFHKTEREVFTLSAQQVRKQIYSSSIGRWKNYAGMLEPFHAEVKDMLKSYGYPDK